LGLRIAVSEENVSVPEYALGLPPGEDGIQGGGGRVQHLNDVKMGGVAPPSGRSVYHLAGDAANK
jgi:hypothetical protein